MLRGTWLGLATAMMLAAMAGSAAAQAPANPQPLSGPVYVITFFEVAPAAAAKALPFLRAYAADSRKADGNAGVRALRETARPARLAIVGVWRDKAAVDAHTAALAALRDKLQPVLASPFDTRSNVGLDVAGPAIGAAPGTVFVLTHVDVFPAGKDHTIEMLKQLAADSRKEPGNLSFDVLQQEGRLNHLPVFEAWRNAGAHEAHIMAEHTRGFRAKLVPLQGALYDERLYQAVR